MDGDVIDFQAYLERDSEIGPRAFAVWGAEGERARLALPVWRAVYLLGSDRGGIVRVPREGRGDPIAHFVLDLGQEPARTGFSREAIDLLAQRSSPSLVVAPSGEVAILLGAELGQRWYLVVPGGSRSNRVEGKDREDLLFLAGECSGLLFLRDLARDPP